jgi:hypothetical protein
MRNRSNFGQKSERFSFDSGKTAKGATMHTHAPLLAVTHIV